MNILFINGSPNENGNTADLAKILLQGQNCEILNLVDYQINTYGQTLPGDQFDEVLKKMKGADVLVIGSPLYWHNTCGSVRNLLDRCYGPLEQGSLNGKLFFLFQGASPEKWMMEAGEFTMSRFARMFGGSAGTDNEPEAEVPGESNILVAYFSWSGNSQQMANWVAEETGGEIFRIVPSESYGADYGACADRAQNELNNEIRPEISTHIDAEIMAEYDLIYLGYPVWWYDLPAPVWTFIEEYDLSGKTIIPFFTHNGSSSGANSLSRVSELAAPATVLSDNAISIPGSNVPESEQEVKDWAKEQLP